MKALRVTYRNSSKTVALEHPGVLNAIVNCIDVPDRGEEHMELRMGGLDCHTDTHVRWTPVDLSVGDKVTIEVIEDCDGDPSDETEERNPMIEEERRKEYIRSEATKLGWELIES